MTSASAPLITLLWFMLTFWSVLLIGIAERTFKRDYWQDSHVGSSMRQSFTSPVGGALTIFFSGTGAGADIGAPASIFAESACLRVCVEPNWAVSTVDFSTWEAARVRR